MSVATRRSDVPTPTKAVFLLADPAILCQRPPTSAAPCGWNKTIDPPKGTARARLADRGGGGWKGLVADLLGLDRWPVAGGRLLVLTM